MSTAADCLFELGTEELPPTALRGLRDALATAFTRGLDEARLAHGAIESFASPRRLALIVRDLSHTQPDRAVERRGPAVAAAFDAGGKPTKAAEGFARSCATSVDALERMATDQGEWLVFRSQESGRGAAELLPEIARQALEALPIPKRMRWGAGAAEFVRPAHWLVFLHGSEVVPCRLLDVDAGRETRGHRFHHPHAIALGNADDYAARLESPGHVLAEFDARKQKVRQLVEGEAAKLDAEADLDDALLDEVTALVEWPVAIVAGFESRFLEVPHEALVLTMKQNQKYFPLFDRAGRLSERFVVIANLESPHPEFIRAGNERVVRPRLADAMFFWQQDGKRRLEDHLETLKGVVFQHKLGSMYDKSERVAALAGWIAGRTGADTDIATRAGWLSRCDLMTQMVYEFPEMQGVMGRYQATRDGEAEAVATALEEFYRPRQAGDHLPATPAGMAVALAERMDTLVAIFGIGQRPTGDKDPYALRRAAIGALRILREHALDIELDALLAAAAAPLAKTIDAPATVADVRAFLFDRLRGLYSDDGISADLFDAVAAVNPPTLIDFERRIAAVLAFRRMPEAESLAAANKRIANILKKNPDEAAAEPDPTRFEHAAERELAAALDAAATEIAAAARGHDYAGILERLAGLRGAVDRFFDEVLVMAEDPAVRANRIGLLARLRTEFLRVADLSGLG